MGLKFCASADNNDEFVCIGSRDYTVEQLCVKIQFFCTGNVSLTIVFCLLKPEGRNLPIYFWQDFWKSPIFRG